MVVVFVDDMGVCVVARLGPYKSMSDPSGRYSLEPLATGDQPSSKGFITSLEVWMLLLELVVAMRVLAT